MQHLDDVQQPYIERHTETLRHERRVVQCTACELVQFYPEKQRCRRCHASFEIKPIETKTEVSSETVVETKFVPLDDWRIPISLAVKTLRFAAGLSQRQLGLRIGVPRTYITKVETANTEPTVDQLERFATAFGLSTRLFVLTIEACRGTV